MFILSQQIWCIHETSALSREALCFEPLHNYVSYLNANSQWCSYSSIQNPWSLTKLLHSNPDSIQSFLMVSTAKQILTSNLKLLLLIYISWNTFDGIEQNELQEWDNVCVCVWLSEWESVYIRERDREANSRSGKMVLLNTLGFPMRGATSPPTATATTTTTTTATPSGVKNSPLRQILDLSLIFGRCSETQV